MANKFIYTVASSGNQILEQMASETNNLANASTDGFRAMLNSARAVPVVSKDLPVQAFALDATVGTDFSAAPTHVTGRNLDVAVQGKGWLVVQDSKGNEAYTRAGSLRVDPEGLLQTQQGQYVLSNAGPITIPPDQIVTISVDGTVSTIQIGNQVSNSNLIGQLKLVNPSEDNLVRGDDGLFRTKDGVSADTDPAVRVVSGVVEDSNVNTIKCLVGFISLQRQFDANMKLMTTAQTNEEKANTMLNRNA